MASYPRRDSFALAGRAVVQVRFLRRAARCQITPSSGESKVHPSLILRARISSARLLEKQHRPAYILEGENAETVMRPDAGLHARRAPSRSDSGESRFSHRPP